MSEGLVQGLWRFPVLGMRGESLRAAQLGVRGLAGDRQHYAAGPEGRLTASDVPRLSRWSAAYPFNPDGALRAEDPPPFPQLTDPTGRSAFRWGDPRLALALERDLGRPIELLREVDVPGAVIVSLTAVDGEANGVNLHVTLPPLAGGWAGRELVFGGGVRLRLLFSRADGPGIEARVTQAGRIVAGERVTLG